MLGAAYGFKLRSHFALMFLVKTFNERGKKIVSTLITFALTVFFVIFIYKGFCLILEVTIDQIAPATQMPVAVPYLAAPVGGILMIYYIIRNWWVDLKNVSTAFIHQDKAEADELVSHAKDEMETGSPAAEPS